MDRFSRSGLRALFQSADYCYLQKLPVISVRAEMTLIYSMYIYSEIQSADSRQLFVCLKISLRHFSFFSISHSQTIKSFLWSAEHFQDLPAAKKKKAKNRGQCYEWTCFMVLNCAQWGEHECSRNPRSMTATQEMNHTAVTAAAQTEDECGKRALAKYLKSLWGESHELLVYLYFYMMSDRPARRSQRDQTGSSTHWQTWKDCNWWVW